MEPEKRKELWGVIQAIGSVYCCVIGTWVIIHPPGSQTATTATQGSAPVSPHLVWWQVVIIIGFVICALTLAIGALVNFFPRMVKKAKPKLVIHRAFYGAGPIADTDITESLRNAARDGLVIPVDNNLVPKDPAPGVRKRLMVEYSYGDGIVCCAVRMESTLGDIVRLVLPEDSELQKLKTALGKEKQNLTERTPLPASNGYV